MATVRGSSMFQCQCGHKRAVLAHCKLAVSHPAAGQRRRSQERRRAAVFQTMRARVVAETQLVITVETSLPLQSQAALALCPYWSDTSAQPRWHCDSCQGKTRRRQFVLGSESALSDERTPGSHKSHCLYQSPCVAATQSVGSLAQPSCAHLEWAGVDEKVRSAQRDAARNCPAMKAVLAGWLLLLCSVHCGASAAQTGEVRCPFPLFPAFRRLAPCHDQSMLKQGWRLEDQDVMRF